MKKPIFNRAKDSFLNKMPLWLQIVFLISSITSVIIIIVLSNMYLRSRQTIITTEAETTNKLLELEMQSLERYIKDLTTFSIQPCYDSSFTQIMQYQNFIDVSEKNYIQNEMRGYFYSRNDIDNYRIFFMKQSMVFSRTIGAQDVSPFSKEEMLSSIAYKRCNENPYFHAILPTESDKTFLNYYHSIIRIKNRIPLAIVNFEVDNTYVDVLNKNHNEQGEFLCILNDQNQLLYSGNKGLVHTNSGSLIKRILLHSSDPYYYQVFNGQKFLVTMKEGSTFQLKIISFKPLESIDSRVFQAQRSSILWGMILWLISVILTIISVRLATGPLSTLANKLQDVGKGDFTSTVSIYGSKEINHLSQNFNDMIYQIDELIRKNYLSELNEKTARLIALESQINPHFLYNTLQAISTEALLNDQMNIHNMINCLATNLRYTIKGGDFVRLKDEMIYVNNYIALQKMRLDERLSVSILIDPDTESLYIPKISIQTLVENSIIHGIGEQKSSIHIDISAKTDDKGKFLLITVRDNGCGISHDYLEKLEQNFSNPKLTGESAGIGLINLNSRLHLLYNNHSFLTIDSEVGSFTSITLHIPITSEVPHV